MQRVSEGSQAAAGRAMRRHVRFGLEDVAAQIASRAGAAQFERVRPIRSAP
jgi:hypothetical protein